MTDIKEKSGILTWTEENVKNAPSKSGVYILRTSPTNGAIIYIGKSSSIKERLLKHFKEEDISGVEFFDWYVTETEKDADLLKEEWSTKYDL